jgi:pyruvate dehydrogenase E2 component (dihydrolipoamide acetyltransferase)
MSIKSILMPQLSDTMQSAKIIKWHKTVGSFCNRGDILAEVETDKANLEIECFDKGVLVSIDVKEGEVAKVGAQIATIRVDSVETAELKENVTPTKLEVTQQTATNNHFEGNSELTSTQKFEGQQERLKASPLAKKLAAEAGLNLAELSGSGPQGRVVKADVERSLTALSQSASAVAKSPSEGSSQRRTMVKLEPKTEDSSVLTSKMRKAIAETMTKSFSEIPHFYVKTFVAADRLLSLKETLSKLELYKDLSLTHLFLKGLALAVNQVRDFARKWHEGQLVEHENIDIGVVVAVDDGLLVPIVKNCLDVPLHQLIAEANSVIARARAKKPLPTDLSGGCIAISNLGMFDVDEFSAIIYPGHSAILAVSSIRKTPIVVDEQIKIVKGINLVLSVDHRVADGIKAAQLLKHLKYYLEAPELLIA